MRGPTHFPAQLGKGKPFLVPFRDAGMIEDIVYFRHVANTFFKWLSR